MSKRCGPALRPPSHGSVGLRRQRPQRVTLSGYDRRVRWVQKIVEGGKLPRYTAYLVRDKENGPVSRNRWDATVSRAEAERPVASGGWRYVERAEPD
jgi:hypothetical protein